KMNPFLAAAHQEHLDNLAGWERVLEEQKGNIDKDLKDSGKKSDYFDELTELLGTDDNFWLVICGGANYDELRDKAIEKIATDSLKSEENEYYPD
ncbi:hypothetical protein, partial [Rodentibacter pneumotropicus]